MSYFPYKIESLKIHIFLIDLEMAKNKPES